MHAQMFRPKTTVTLEKLTLLKNMRKKTLISSLHDLRKKGRL